MGGSRGPLGERPSVTSSVPKRLAKIISKNLERISDMFRRLDKSGDGNISKAELSDGLTRVIGLDLRWMLLLLL